MIELDNLYGMVKQDWSKQEILDAIDKINTDLDSRVCENCTHGGIDLDDRYYCDKGIIEHYRIVNNSNDFGCNKFKRREDGK